MPRLAQRIAYHNHARMISNYRSALVAFKAPLTVENLSRLAREFEKSARKLKPKARAGSLRHRDWRLASLQAARVYWTLCREVSNGRA